MSNTSNAVTGEFCGCPLPSAQVAMLQTSARQDDRSLLTSRDAHGRFPDFKMPDIKFPKTGIDIPGIELPKSTGELEAKIKEMAPDELKELTSKLKQSGSSYADALKDKIEAEMKEKKDDFFGKMKDKMPFFR